MKIVAWVLAAIIGLGVIGGLVYLGSHDSSGNGLHVQKPELGAAGKQAYHVDVDGITRSFIVYRPSNLPKDKKVPVVFMYHGTSGSGEKMYNTTAWKSEADKNGFMVVYPSALRYHIIDPVFVNKTGKVFEDHHAFTTKWNAYELPNLMDPKYQNQTPADDVQFTREMVDFVNKNYATDQNRFYATGFSNGGQFVNRLIVETPDIFAAFAPSSANGVSSSLLDKIDEMGAEITPRPVIQAIGQLDPKLTHAAGVAAFTTDESATQDGNAVKDDYISQYIRLEHLNDQYTYEDVNGSGTFTYSDSLTGADNVYELIVIKNMKHVYPNGENFPLNISDVYWNFFKSYSL